MKKAIFAVTIFVVLGLGYAVYQFGKESFFNVYGEQKEDLLFEVPSGASLSVVAKDLVKQGLISNPRAFVFFARVFEPTHQVKSGEYLLPKGSSGRQILSILNSGKAYQRFVTIPEGWNLFDVAAEFARVNIITQEKFLSLVRDPVFVEQLLGQKGDSLEGYLFPETYAYTKSVDVKNLIGQMVRKSLDEYNILANEGQTELNRHQVFTLASIVEKETGAPQERPMIASVFYNRLSKGMRLQTDPTVIYSLALMTGVMPTNIRKADLQVEHPFNTYVQKGLPPGPISNPGRASLGAVFRPAKSEFLFFVSQNDGTHVFTKTYQDHQKAVGQFQLDPKAREGKSWRQLGNSPAGN